jgi:AcrR family transcriptional regulator
VKKMVLKKQRARQGGRPSRRGEIVATASRLLRERGVQGVTTRAIAESVPCSEGAIYVHFRDRLDLILAVLEESLPEMLEPLHALQQQVGHGSAARNLALAVEGLVRFHRKVMVMLCSLLGEPELRDRFRRSLLEGGRGPERGIRTLANYIEEEQRLGRIGREIGAQSAARALMAGAFFHVFTEELLGRSARLDAGKLVNETIRAKPRGTRA